MSSKRYRDKDGKRAMNETEKEKFKARRERGRMYERQNETETEEDNNHKEKSDVVNEKEDGRQSQLWFVRVKENHTWRQQATQSASKKRKKH